MAHRNLLMVTLLFVSCSNTKEAITKKSSPPVTVAIHWDEINCLRALHEPLGVSMDALIGMTVRPLSPNDFVEPELFYPDHDMRPMIRQLITAQAIAHESGQVFCQARLTRFSEGETPRGITRHVVSLMGKSSPLSVIVTAGSHEPNQAVDVNAIVEFVVDSGKPGLQITAFSYGEAEATLLHKLYTINGSELVHMRTWREATL